MLKPSGSSSMGSTSEMTEAMHIGRTSMPSGSSLICLLKKQEGKLFYTDNGDESKECEGEEEPHYLAATG